MNAPMNRTPRRHLLAPAFAFCATLLALPSAAVTIPDVPLQSGSAYPPANVMFILDDSGSMEFDFMPGSDSASEVPATTPVNVALNAYTRNTLYYNPGITYLPWVRADDTRYSGGTSYNSAYSHDSLLSDAINLGASTRTFYVPKEGATDLAATASYWRYQIPVGGGDMIRSEYGAVTGGTNSVSPFPQNSADATTGNLATAYAITVPAGVERLTVTSSGGRHGTNGGANNDNGSGADLYLRFNNAPTTAVYDCRSTGNDNNESCTIDNPAAGTWYVRLSAGSSFRNVQLDATIRTPGNRCGGGSGTSDWINCTSATPQYRDANNALANRTLAAELQNYATWYSYHRTRIKVAKAGASEAFSRLGTGMRVGYDSIWNRNPLRIPVGTGNGLFTGTNRSDWFTHLHAANGNSGTPLKGALQRAGRYFGETGADGPWGPETGNDQISCRQNFAILTTDGYWNNDTGYDNPVGDTDNTAGPTITGPNDKTFAYAPAKPYMDNFATNPRTRANTLADVAMEYWKRDLRDNLENNVPSTLADPAWWQHMVTFGVSIGLQGRLDPATDLKAIELGSKHWGDPTDAEDADRIDDLWHAAVNGHGNFVSARNPTEFAQALADALSTVAARLGSASNVTANTTSFTAGSRVYQASYVSGRWVGELAAYDATAAGVADTPAWRASTRIAYAGRNVVTWNGTAGASFPTPAQVTALARTTGIAPVTGAANANYIKGDWGSERRMGGTLRNRDSLLGDIANSSPMYAIDSNTLFVGANDGMLHAFDASSGNELFAYVPGGLDLSWLSTLSDPQYAHKYFVDGPIVVSSNKQTPGRNVLVGALGRGGKGLFALDVTTPASFSASNAMWELRDNGGDMGMVLGDPLIVTLNDAAKTKAAIVSNGINSTNGHAVLFVVDLMTGTVLKKIDTGNQGADNGLSEPRGRDLDGNGTVDVVYAGDLKGNLWKFDLSGTTSATWTIAVGGQPLYRTRSGQPISAGVAVARNPLDNKAWVFFGTGRYMSSTDVGDTTLQTMYGIVDEGTQVSEAELQSRDIAIVTTADGKAVRAFEKSAPLPLGKRGWFVDLDAPRPGERIVVRPQVRGVVLITSSMLPPTPTACDAGGSGYLNAIDAFTGTALSAVFFDLNGDGLFDDNDKIGTGNDATGVGSIDTGVGNPTKGTFIDNMITLTGSNGTLAEQNTQAQGGMPRRVMWREILQD